MILVDRRAVSLQKSHSIEWLFYWSVRALVILVLIASVMLVVGCTAKPQKQLLTGATMGTTWHVTYLDDPAANQADKATVQAGIEAVLESVNSSMSTYRVDSEVSQFNQASTDTWIELSPAFFTVLDAAMSVGTLSNGSYDVSVGPLVDLWGFGPRGIVTQPPERAEIEKVLARVGQQFIHVDTADNSSIKRAKKSRPIEVDFSSLAKGYGVDQVAQWLARQGIANFLVEVGGELRVSGVSPRGDRWKIAIESPDVVSADIAPSAALSVTNMAIATSGDYRNYFENNGQRYSHTIDPRSGYPVQDTLVSVTVVHASAMLADAWATALMAMGLSRATAVANEEGLAVYFIEADAQALKHSHTSALAAYLAN